MAFNSETAKIAGSKNHKTRKVDKFRAIVGPKLIGQHAARYNAFMNELWKEGTKESKREFMEWYFKGIVFVLPKLQAHAIKQQTEIKVTIGGEDQVLFEDI